ncbi:uncharacterized protein LOC143038416 isoform X2 [Oratosquilla oratoria]|uniref:uncharacterized protein LOC143038416 isoform X2 n=1 Tax=Oratosquilla oratoria TaxID=337810 RepID=UPI003F763AD9
MNTGKTQSLLDLSHGLSPVTSQGGSRQDQVALNHLTGKTEGDMVSLKMEGFKSKEPEMLPTPLPLEDTQAVENGVQDEGTSSGKEESPKDCIEDKLSEEQNEEVSLLELTKPTKDKMSEGTGTNREGAVDAVEHSQDASKKNTMEEQGEDKKTDPKKEVEGPSSVPRKGVGIMLPELDVEDSPSVPRKGVETTPVGQSVPRKGVVSNPPSVVPKKGVGKGPEPQDLARADIKSASIPRKGVGSQSVPRKGVEAEPPPGVPETVHTLVGNGTQMESNSTLHINNSSTHNSSRAITPVATNLTQNSSAVGVPSVESHLNKTAGQTKPPHNKPPTSDEAFMKSPYGDGSVVGNSYSLQIFIFVLLCLILAGGILGYTRLQDVWMRRHYARVDFLVDGMYQN